MSEGETNRDKISVIDPTWCLVLWLFVAVLLNTSWPVRKRVALWIVLSLVFASVVMVDLFHAVF